MTAAGDVGDYDADAKADLTANVASTAGVSADLVTITIEAGSVIITATIDVPETTTSADVQSTLETSLGSAAEASAALGITVESTPSVTVAAPPPSLPPSPPSASTTTPAVAETPEASTSSGDPHFHLAHGGVADFRGRNGSHYVLLSAPGVQFAGQTLFVDFLLPRPQLVHGSFFTNATWTVRGISRTNYTISSDANAPGFTVRDDAEPAPTGGYDASLTLGAWDQWSQDGVLAWYKQSTLVVRANGWEVNATRRPIYNHIAGPSKWRFDIAMRPLDGTTGLEAAHGKASESCFPHGLIGQSWDGDEIAISGTTDDYTFKSNEPTITTKAMAEGAIEGAAADYELITPSSTQFTFSRFDEVADATCAPRDIKKLTGKKHAAATTPLVGSND